MVESPSHQVEKLYALRLRECPCERVLDPVGERTSQKISTLPGRIVQKRSRGLVDEALLQTHFRGDIADGL